MSQRVALDERAWSEYELGLQWMENNPIKPVILGRCADCGRGIPAGYIPMVTSWTSVNWGFPNHKPKEMFCKDCASKIVVKRGHKPDTPATDREALEMALSNLSTYSPKQQAKILERARQFGITKETSMAEQTQEMSAKEIAVALLTTMDGLKHPHSAKWLAEKIEVDDVEIVEQILERLAGADKVTEEDGKWVKS